MEAHSSRTASRTLARLATLSATALLALAAAAARSSSPPRAAPTRPPDAQEPRAASAELAGPARNGPWPAHPLAEELRCASCHAAIVDEWAASAHAHAWLDPLYQSELATKQRPESCHGCHIPTSLEQTKTNEKPAPRAIDVEAHELGVSCATCHAGPDDSMLGPFGAPTSAHASKHSERFDAARSNELCLGCHSTTIGPVIGVGREYLTGQAGVRASERAPGDGARERGAANGGGAIDGATPDSTQPARTCVGCHMEALERSIATDSNDEPLPPRAGRSHRLLGPWDSAFLARAFEASARIDADGEHTVVALANAAGHRVPGLLDRRFEFTVDALGADGSVLASATLVIDNRAFLAADATKELRLAARAANVRVRGTHHARRLGEPVPFLDLRVAPSR